MEENAFILVENLKKAVSETKAEIILSSADMYIVDLTKGMN
jgi:hypothetical protein